MLDKPGSPLSEVGGAPSPLTTGERVRVEELAYFSGFLRDVAAAKDGVDPDYLRLEADELDFRAKLIVEDARRLMRKGPAQIVDGPYTNVRLRVINYRDPRPMDAAEVEGPCRALEGAAVDVVRAVNDLRGAQEFRYADGLVMIADQLITCARYMREMSEGMEESDE